MAAEPGSGGDEVTFELADPQRRYRAVRLTSGLSLRGDDRALRRAGTGAWSITLRRPAVDRLEYEFEVERADGTSEHICDPANPERTEGEFGERSVLHLSDYRKPAWLDAAAVAGDTEALSVHSRALRADVPVEVWAPADADATEALPLLVAHDGPAYERVSRLTQYSGALIAARVLPRHRVALLSAPDRGEWYSASARYARALATEILPALRGAFPVAAAPVGMGASLGGLAMLHAEHRYPGTLGALLLQSSSFFATRFDSHESGFARYSRIVRFVSSIRRQPAPAHAPPVVLTCGIEEENVHNNRAMAQALAVHGWPVELHEIRGLHDHVAWRDALDPHLTVLLGRVWPSAT
jgi:enterochelin esterase family protein